MNFLPSIIGAIVVLIIGWILSSIVARLFEKALHAAHFEQAVERAGIGDFIQRTGSRLTGSHIVAVLLKWFIRLIFIQAAANILRFPEITAILNEIMVFVPRVIIAIAILVLGSMLAKFLAAVVRGSIAEMGVDNPDFFAKLTQYLVVGFAIIAALDQIEVAKTVVDTLLIGLVAAVALASGLAFGLGGRDVGNKIMDSWYDKTRRAPRRAAD